jgi:hypothetical protein
MKFRNNNNIYQYIKSRVEVDFRKSILIRNKNNSKLFMAVSKKWLRLIMNKKMT